MIGGEAARRYARALVDIAESRGVLDETGEALSEIAGEFQGNQELRRVLLNPRLARAERVKILDEIMAASGADELLRNFVRVVAEKDRIGELTDMAHSYQQLADERRGRVRAQVKAAYDLDAEAIEGLREKLSEITGREVLMEVETDETLIGGLVCRVGGVVMDGSIKNQLRNLRNTLITS